jgi:PAS domain-containing protein
MQRVYDSARILSSLNRPICIVLTSMLPVCRVGFPTTLFRRSCTRKKNLHKMTSKFTSAAQAPSGSACWLDHSPMPMAAVESSSHTLQYANRAFCRLMNKPLEQLVGRMFRELLPEEDKCLKLLDEVFRAGKPESHTQQRPSKSHPIFWSYTMWPVSVDERTAGVMIQVTETAQFREKTLAMNEALMLGAVRQHELTETAENLNARLRVEITEREHAEEALRGSEERYRTLFDMGPVAVYSCDGDGVIKEFNRRAAELWGREPEEGNTEERFCGSFRLFRPDGSFMRPEESPMAEVVNGLAGCAHHGPGPSRPQQG